jgi:hypothetical protein
MAEPIPMLALKTIGLVIVGLFASATTGCVDANFPLYAPKDAPVADRAAVPGQDTTPAALETLEPGRFHLSDMEWLQGRWLILGFESNETSWSYIDAIRFGYWEFDGTDLRIAYLGDSVPPSTFPTRKVVIEAKNKRITLLGGEKPNDKCSGTYEFESLVYLRVSLTSEKSEEKASHQVWVLKKEGIGERRRQRIHARVDATMDFFEHPIETFRDRYKSDR